MYLYYSWTSYFLVIGFLLFAYFIIIGITYYKKEILSVLKKKDPMQAAIDAPVKRPDLLPMVHELVSELGAVIRTASQNNMVIPKLLTALKEKIRDFSLLEPTDYKAKINLYISQELEIHGIDMVSQQQIEQLWKSP